jgi:uncharacterized protein DUF4236
MGFYIRKSLKVGPVRLNLSKSGVGMSVGVKGARAGIDAKGRGYVHAGRGGLYYRSYLSSGHSDPADSLSSSTPDRTSLAPLPSLAPGAKQPTFLNNSTDPRQPDLLRPFIPGAILLACMILSSGWTSTFLLITTATLLVGGAVVRNRKLYADHLLMYERRAADLGPEQPGSLLAWLQKFRTQHDLQAEHLNTAHIDAYQRAVEAVFTFAPRTSPITPPTKTACPCVWCHAGLPTIPVSEDERQKTLTWPARVAASFQLTPVTCATGRRKAYHALAAKFSKASGDEQQALWAGMTWLRHDVDENGSPLLGRGMDELSEDMNLLADFERGRLLDVSADIPLRAGDRCYYRGWGLLQSSSDLFQSSDFYRQGVIYLTSSGIVLVFNERSDGNVFNPHSDNGTISIPFAKLFEVAWSDSGSEDISLMIEGQGRPLFLTVSHPRFVHKLLLHLWQAQGAL